ncbi:DNA polymerase zeta catalytic subunit-like [Carica papaya]|uniref:DNA polymerase zeta catalytic subunit-like n=1 Tax=Carica papaya TaxID=3649 RepID=UPI000B8C79BE|nr:DNA polymerase zeta catalytic subunit-like [Carica papaya]XP_021898706.1 DNA polymerase zeta catalytic subunit-like [Carica papaya]XP_021898707.1 DNA polymerase zeta catalytic subunit-like [Carica papaya]XP_021898708.1 DNA polymerase zeta catalytic subunit-like [Carica papaya]XP_021898709.1 DNA polymerase zeta catalytic subunit-like [Carica papaya]
MADFQPNSNIFSVRIVSIDFDMVPPIPDLDICYSSFQGGGVNEVPVIRVYGSTPAGQKTCLHVHRALPYLYVPCSDISLNPHQEGDAYTHAISLALEKSLKLKGNVGSKRQHVHGCSLVRAKRFYGYHGSEELFVKIYLYYPHDVARAASLLLGGSVLDKSLQPYESHIPFILQFLIDYNLYGMGYIHLSHIKFRHPVPNVFSPRNTDYKSFQADSRTGASFDFPVWISSTIPSDWMWHLSNEFDGLKGSQLDHVKRQSACGLEGDANVEDILNQQFKMYNSLSQTGSDVKMVQSLIPIWEEEYERSGMHEPTVPPESGKPLPGDVLKTLSLDLGFENKFAELCNEAEEILTLSQSDEKPVQSMASSADEENFSALAHVNPDNTNLQVLHCSREKNILRSLSTQGLQCEDKIDGTLSEGKDTEDMEALELLKWLASSQAAEDINSDDELVRETILSPLLPATTIDKVLEKANMDYESESQKECQDILDSVEDFVDFEATKERASNSVFPCNHLQSSADEKIPQLDGSGDDPHMSPSAGSTEDSLKLDTKSEPKETPQQTLVDTNKSNISKDKTRNSLWSSLSFIMPEKMDDNSHVTFMAGNGLGICSNPLGEHIDTDVCDVKVSNKLTGCSVRDLMRRKRCNKFESPEQESVKVKKIIAEREKKTDACVFPEDDMHEKMSLHSLDFRPSFSNSEAGFCETGARRSTYLEFSMDDTVSFPFRSESTSHVGAPSSTVEKEAQWTSNPEIKQESAVPFHQCEPYNRKDSDFRFKLAGSTRCGVYCTKSGSFSGVEQLEFNTKDKPLMKEGMQKLDAVGPSCFTPLIVHQEMLDEDKCLQNHDQETKKCMESAYNVSDNKLKDIDTSIDMRTCRDMAEDGSCLIGLTLRKKSPTLDQSFSENESYLLANPFQDSHVGGKNYKETSGRSSDEILPFFDEDLEGWKEVQSKCLGNIMCDNVHQEAVMGVPTHFQNDGSFLYLLLLYFHPLQRIVYPRG